MYVCKLYLCFIVSYLCYLRNILDIECYKFVSYYKDIGECKF